MKKLTIIGGAALIALAGAAVAQQATTRPDRNADVTRQQTIERADQRFDRLDTNNDGRVTAEEARQVHQQRRAERAGRMFERLDLNGDGSITRAEFDQAHAQRAERRGARGAEVGEHRMRGMRHGRHGMRGDRGSDMFGEQGFITREQMRERAVARFDRLDANRDGTLTAAERRQARQEMRQRMQERRSQAD